MWVKICGTTSLADAQLALAAGAKAIGFVFAPSKRQMNAADVRAILQSLPADTLTVGVFTSQSAEEILATAGAAGVSGVQLHRSYLPALVTAVAAGLPAGKRIFQVVEVPALWTADAEEHLSATLHSVLADDRIDILLDTAIRAGSGQVVSGGTGTSFDWGRVRLVLNRLRPARRSSQQVGLAGGLRPENIAEAIKVLQPDFVDVVSGVEAAPGVKNALLVADFVRTALTYGG